MIQAPDLLIRALSLTCLHWEVRINLGWVRWWVPIQYILDQTLDTTVKNLLQVWLRWLDWCNEGIRPSYKLCKQNRLMQCELKS
jgi:hypothetical protein